jgi:DNA-binding IclR family transcriptional regulator
VRDHEGQVAALNLGTLTARFHARREEIIMAVKEAAAQVNHPYSQNIGPRLLPLRSRM